MTPPSESLFPESGGPTEDRTRLFELLTAHLGADNVLQATPMADYQPQEANRWAPIDEKAKGTAAQLPPHIGGMDRPAWLLAKPIALLMRDHRPFYGSPLGMVSGPERIEAGWRSDTAARDYFIAEEQDHAKYWVYRERTGSVDDAEDLR